MDVNVRENNLTSKEMGNQTPASEDVAQFDYIMSLLALRVFFYCVYMLIFFVGIFGNVLVCYVVFRTKAMMSVTNLFIANLALSDILLCIFAVPFTPLYLLTFRHWAFGGILCHLVPFAQGISVYISAFTLMSIAIDRFFVIIYPFKPRMKISVCLVIIICVWMASILLTLPYAIFMEVITMDDGKTFCEEVWPYEESRKAFGFSTSVLQFVIPFIIISFCYIRVCGKLSLRARSMPGLKTARKEEQEKERTQKTNRMLIAMVIIFGVSWLPLNLHNLILDFYTEAARWKFARSFFLLAHAVAMSSCCYNPFLYAWLNENFRKEFKQVLPCFRVNSCVLPKRNCHQNARENKKNKNCSSELQQQQLNESNGQKAVEHNNMKTFPGNNRNSVITGTGNVLATSSEATTTTTFTTDITNTSNISSIQITATSPSVIPEDEEDNRQEDNANDNENLKLDDSMVTFDTNCQEVMITKVNRNDQREIL